MGSCQSCKSSSKYKSKERIKTQTEKSVFQIGPPDISLPIPNSQYQKANDEKQIIEKLEYFLSSEIGYKLRSGVHIKNLISYKSLGIISDLMMIELSKHIYRKIKEQDYHIKDFHRYIQAMKQLIDVTKAILETFFEKLDMEKLVHFSNKNSPYIIFSNILIVFHAIIFHKCVLWVKPEDRWWAKNKNDDNFQSLLSMIIEIAGKIKYEYEPKFSLKKKGSMLNSKTFSINSHEENMKKSSKSNESKSDKNKKESDFFFIGVNARFTEKVAKEEEPKLLIKRGRSSEEIVAKYGNFDEILEDANDKINDEETKNSHKANDCLKYMFNLSPKVKKPKADK